MEFEREGNPRKAYRKPVVEATAMKLGVYGSYGGDDNPPTGGRHHGGRRGGGGRRWWWWW
jgi:hypothetical protein